MQKTEKTKTKMRNTDKKDKKKPFRPLNFLFFSSLYIINNV